jgi:hypothetical protein
MFLKLKINANERIAQSNEDNVYEDVLVNMDQVLTVSPQKGAAGKTKLRFRDGHTLICGQSADFILASIDGTLDSGYRAPEPKDA